MKITKESIIGELVALDYRTASVFKNNKIDFCCNGNRTIEDACNQKQIEYSTLLQQLDQIVSGNKESGVDYNSWPLDLLADYIEKKHHRYVDTKIQEIKPYLEKVIKVHSGHHPELIEIGKLFEESADELTKHMKKEELMLFPHIRKMVQAEHSGSKVQAPFGTVQNPIKMMMLEHDNEGERFRKISSLSDNYTPPADACNTYRVTYSLLKEFEDDLHLHIHLENNILFPKAIILEESLVND
ncbi:MAG: iron-sulfur cluster repair di-iron protein [Bacteroidales bacterium]